MHVTICVLDPFKISRLVALAGCGYACAGKAVIRDPINGWVIIAGMCGIPPLAGLSVTIVGAH